MFCFIRFLIDIKSPLTPELYVKIYIEMSRQALLYTAISALRPCLMQKKKSKRSVDNKNILKANKNELVQMYAKWDWISCSCHHITLSATSTCSLVFCQTVAFKTVSEIVISSPTFLAFFDKFLNLFSVRSVCRMWT